MPTMGRSTASAQAWTHASAIGRKRRAGVPAGAACELRAAGHRVELEPANRVDQRETVRARGGDRPRRLGDVPRRRRELRVQRLGGRLPRRGNELGSSLGRLLDVRAREVQLDRHDVVAVVEPRADVGVVRGREPADRDPDGHAERREPRQVVPDERLDSRVLQADRVQHPRVRLGDARRRVALARERRHRLRHEGVEAPGDARCGERVEAPGGVEDGDHAASCRTGPSTHRRTYRPSRSTTHP